MLFPKVVEKALNILRTAIANQMDWKDIEEIISEAGENGDPILSKIRKLKLDINHFTMVLTNPFEQAEDSSQDEEDSEVGIKWSLDLCIFDREQRSKVLKEALLLLLLFLFLGRNHE